MTWRETCRVIVGEDEEGLLVRTVFPDGSHVDARVTPVSDRRSTLCHDLLHTLLAVQEGCEHSSVLWAMAHGGIEDKDAAAREEDRVMRMQELGSEKARAE